MISLYLIFQITVLGIIVLPVFYIFAFSLAGLFYKQERIPSSPVFSRIAVLIPAYSEDEVIPEVARDALLQQYPKEKYDVIVIADSFQPETIADLKSLDLRVIEVKFEKSTKVKALNRAMDVLDTEYDIAVVLDADNLMARDFLSKINDCFAAGGLIIQGHRTARNTDNSLAVLDAASEEINNHIFRKGHRVLGFSSAIIGSGMAFPYKYFRNLMSGLTATGGFDKEIELRVLKEGRRIIYLDDALVFDEKVKRPDTFSNQRRRWLSAQFIYFRKDLNQAFRQLIINGNIDYFDKICQFIQPPRILLFGTTIISGILFGIINIRLHLTVPWNIIWSGVIVSCVLALLLAVPRRMYNMKTIKAVATLPYGMFLMLGSLLRIKGANRHFIHTQHTAGSGRESL